MLEYYKLALVNAGNDKTLFLKELKSAFKNLTEAHERDDLKDWVKSLTAKI